MRQARILEEVRRTGGARVAQLTALLGVSDMTVRRDLEMLDRKGLLSKVHGGATAMDTASAIEPGFEVTSQREIFEKEAIAARAAQLVRPGMAIAITAGSTTWTLARHLGDIANLTVVTNSLKVAEVLHARQRSDLTVVADHTKWGVVGLAQIAPLRAVTTLLTDDRLPAHAAQVLAEQVPEVIIIPTGRD